MITSTKLRLHNEDWHWHLKNAIRDINNLGQKLNISLESFKSDFPLLVPLPYLNRIKKGDLKDPLLLQVLPKSEENSSQEGFYLDPLQEQTQTDSPEGLIQKYSGRALIIAAGACGINCRYCFRRHFPYHKNKLSSTKWEELIDYIKSDSSLKEVILSGGDPLLLSDQFLYKLVVKLNGINHLTTIRIHTRLPIVIPNRICPDLIEWKNKCEKNLVFVFHINHPNEIDDQLVSYLSKLKSNNTTLLNQSVLLKNINNDPNILSALSEKLFSAGVLPYYLHLLDPVKGSAHFFVPLREAKQLIEKIKAVLPGYLVPKLARETAGKKSKDIMYY
ncbi:MAG: EF-P beta-lysylation protein EpmB [Gammaproteobacteria bacterium]|nr:EF-P beta-lysylation protein EpmB [Gammaproteobacteria bacterium]|tara:strand:+ start:185 stop:1180 length:996 start_codon:yes stop_codon:yes gene_type:complete